MTTIKEFCSERKLSKQMEDSFVMYCRSTYAQRFELSDGQTVQMLVSNLDKDKVEEAWSLFIHEMKNLISG